MRNREESLIGEEGPSQVGEMLYERLGTAFQMEHAGQWIAFDTDSGYFSVRPYKQDAIENLFECCGDDVSLFTKLIPKTIH